MEQKPPSLQEDVRAELSELHSEMDQSNASIREEHQGLAEDLGNFTQARQQQQEGVFRIDPPADPEQGALPAGVAADTGAVAVAAPADGAEVDPDTLKIREIAMLKSEILKRQQKLLQLEQGWGGKAGSPLQPTARLALDIACESAPAIRFGDGCAVVKRHVALYRKVLPPGAVETAWLPFGMTEAHVVAAPGEGDANKGDSFRFEQRLVFPYQPHTRRQLKLALHEVREKADGSVLSNAVVGSCYFTSQDLSPSVLVNVYKRATEGSTLPASLSMPLVDKRNDDAQAVLTKLGSKLDVGLVALTASDPVELWELNPLRCDNPAAHTLPTTPRLQSREPTSRSGLKLSVDEQLARHDMNQSFDGDNSFSAAVGSGSGSGGGNHTLNRILDDATLDDSVAALNLSAIAPNTPVPQHYTAPELRQMLIVSQEKVARLQADNERLQKELQQYQGQDAKSAGTAAVSAYPKYDSLERARLEAVVSKEREKAAEARRLDLAKLQQVDAEVEKIPHLAQEVHGAEEQAEQEAEAAIMKSRRASVAGIGDQSLPELGTDIGVAGPAMSEQNISMHDQRLELRFECKKLIKMDWLSKSDPMVVVKQQDRDSQLWLTVGKTEFKKNDHNPSFDQEVVLPVPAGPASPLRIEVYDVDCKNVEGTDLMGYVDTDTGALLKWMEEQQEQQQAAEDPAPQLKLMLKSDSEKVMLQRKLKKAGSCVLVRVAPEVDVQKGLHVRINALYRAGQALSGRLDLEEKKRADAEQRALDAIEKGKLDQMALEQATKENVELHVEINELQALVAEAKRAAEAAAAELEALRKQLAAKEQELQEAKEAADKAAAEAKAAADKQRAALEAAEKTVAEQKEQIDKALAEGAQKDARIKELEAQLAEQRAALDEAAANAKEAQAAADKAAADLEQARQQLAEKDKALANASASDEKTAAEAKEAADKAAAELQTLQEQLAAKSQALADAQEAAERDAADAKEAADKAAKEAEEAATQAASELDKLLKQLADKGQALADSKNSAQEAAAAAQNAADKAAADLEQLRQQLEQAKAALAAANAKGGDSEARAAELEAQLKDKTAALDAADRAAVAAKEAADQAADEAKEAADKAATEAQIAADQAASQLDELRKQLAEKDKAAFAAKEAADKAADEAKEAADKAANDLEQLRKQLADASAEGGDSAARVAELQSQLDAAEKAAKEAAEKAAAEVEQLRKELAENEQALADAQVAADKAAAEAAKQVSGLQAGDDELRTRIKELEQQLAAEAALREARTAKAAEARALVASHADVLGSDAAAGVKSEGGVGDEEAAENAEGVTGRQRMSAQDAKELPGQPVELQLACRSLVKMDWLSKSDPMVVVSQRVPGTEGWQLVGETEHKKNNHDPDFERTVTLRVDAAAPAPVLVEVYDVDESNPGRGNLMGSAECSSADIARGGPMELAITSQDAKMNKKLTKAKARVVLKPAVSAEQPLVGGADEVMALAAALAARLGDAQAELDAMKAADEARRARDAEKAMQVKALNMQFSEPTKLAPAQDVAGKGASAGAPDWGDEEEEEEEEEGQQVVKREAMLMIPPAQKDAAPDLYRDADDMMALCEKLAAQLKEAKAEEGGLRDSLADAEARADQASADRLADRAQAQQLVRETKAALDATTKQNEEMEDGLRALDKQLAEAKAALAAANAKGGDSEARLAELEAQLKDKTAALDAADKAAVAAKEAADQAADEAKEAADKAATEAQIAADQAASQLDELRKQLAEKDKAAFAAKEAADKAADEAKEAADKAANDLEQLRKQLAAASAEGGDSAARVTELQLQLKDKTAALVAAEKAAKKAKEAADKAAAEAKAAADKQRAALEAAEKTVAEQKEQIERQEKENASKDAQIADLTEKLAAATSELEQLRKQLADAKEASALAAAKADEAASKASSDHEQLRKKLAEAEAALAKANAHGVDSAAEVQKLKAEVKKLKAQLAAKQAALHANDKAAADARAAAEKAMAEAKAVADKAAARIKKLQAQLAEATQEGEGLDELKAMLAAEKRGGDELQASLAEVRAQLAATKEQAAKEKQRLEQQLEQAAMDGVEAAERAARARRNSQSLQVAAALSAAEAQRARAAEQRLLGLLAEQARALEAALGADKSAAAEAAAADSSGVAFVAAECRKLPADDKTGAARVLVVSTERAPGEWVEIDQVPTKAGDTGQDCAARLQVQPSGSVRLQLFAGAEKGGSAGGAANRGGLVGEASGSAEALASGCVWPLRHPEGGRRDAELTEAGAEVSLQPASPEGAHEECIAHVLGVQKRAEGALLGLLARTDDQEKQLADAAREAAAQAAALQQQQLQQRQLQLQPHGRSTPGRSFWMHELVVGLVVLLLLMTCGSLFVADFFTDVLEQFHMQPEHVNHI